MRNAIKLCLLDLFILMQIGWRPWI